MVKAPILQSSDQHHQPPPPQQQQQQQQQHSHHQYQLINNNNKKLNRNRYPHHQCGTYYFEPAMATNELKDTTLGTNMTTIPPPPPPSAASSTGSPPTLLSTTCPVTAVASIAGTAATTAVLNSAQATATTAIAVVAPTTRTINTNNSANILSSIKQIVPGQSQSITTTTVQQTNLSHAPRIPHQYHHIQFPVPPPGGGTWPIVEPVFHFGPGFEPQTRHYCPTHSQGPQPSEHVVLFHVNPGVSVTFQVAGNREVVRGPVTVPMVSQSGTPPMAMPVQVPPGHVMQQIVDENGTLRHVILSTQHQQIQSGVGVQSVQPHLHYINGTTPHYYQPLAANYPGPVPGTHFHTVASSHLPHQPLSHSPHSPSPPSNYHKDERTQRQHTKLLRKLDQKQRETNNSALSTPAHSPSPRKSNSNELNGLRRMPRNGASSVGTSEDGEESSSVPDEEDDEQLIKDQLSDIQSPEVSEITSRSALVQWSPPTITCDKGLSSKEFLYEVLLSDRGLRDGKYKSIFKGASLSCRIQDLKPAQEYHVRFLVCLNNIKGSPSGPAIFSTPPCEPDIPQIPKLVLRTKNSLQMRWNAPPDNGGPIYQYILEYNEGQGREFVEMIKTKNKNYTLSKLQPSTTYTFRFAAVNDHGKSGYSDEFAFSTQGNPPQQPEPPILQSATSSSLFLSWTRRSNDEEFVLQMNDKDTGHGYLPVYSGREILHECTGLRRATLLYFRLRADNENGSSPWSNEVTFNTMPERPGRPLKPQVKGKIHANSFKVKWDPPADRGGADINLYHLEINLGYGFERCYSGHEAEAVCDRLLPGTNYQVRAMCDGPGGSSIYSDVLSVTTEPVVPGIPAPPFCNNPPAPYAAVLRWEAPEYNGGALIIEYEIEIEGGIPKTRKLAYRGKDKLCVVKDLLPGEFYKVQLRALNRIGAGLWSEYYMFRAGATAPCTPDSMNVIIKSPTHVQISWNEPPNNGSDITEYRLESSTLNADETYSVVYQGLQLSSELRNLTPFTTYYFRMCASNLAGTSKYSKYISIKMPAAAPNAPVIETYEISSNDVILQWNEPESNGSEILFYNIEYSDKVLSTEINVNEFTIRNLNPETTYKIKIQAVNTIGPGGYSIPIKITTLPLPPQPPKLECYGIGSNFLKLKWGEKNAKNIDFKRYYLEMYNTRCREFQRIYSGTNFTFKANKLQEMMTYTFRICAETDYAGMGDYSEEYQFKTCATQPANIKAPRLYHSDDHIPCGTSVTIEWQHSKNTFADPIEYILHLSKMKKDEFKEIYRGPETRYTIDNLVPGVEYQMKVCPVRILPNDEQLLGTFSPILRHSITNTESIRLVNKITSYAVNGGNTGGGIGSSYNLNGGNSSAIVSGHHNNGSNTGGLLSNINTNLYNNNNNSIVNCNNINNNNNLIKTSNLNVRNGIIKTVYEKFTTIYTSRDKWTDQEKAIFYSLFFLLITVIFAAIVKNFIR